MFISTPLPKEKLQKAVEARFAKVGLPCDELVVLDRGYLCRRPNRRQTSQTIEGRSYKIHHVQSEGANVFFISERTKWN